MAQPIAVGAEQHRLHALVGAWNVEVAAGQIRRFTNAGGARSERGNRWDRNRHLLRRETPAHRSEPASKRAGRNSGPGGSVERGLGPAARGRVGWSNSGPDTELGPGVASETRIGRSRREPGPRQRGLRSEHSSRNWLGPVRQTRIVHRRQPQQSLPVAVFRERSSETFRLSRARP